MIKLLQRALFWLRIIKEHISAVWWLRRHKIRPYSRVYNEGLELFEKVGRETDQEPEWMMDGKRVDPFKSRYWL